MTVSPTRFKNGPARELAFVSTPNQLRSIYKSVRLASNAALLVLLTFLLMPAGTAQAQTATAAPITPPRRAH